MSIQRFKVALNNAEFPLVSTKAQRAVFVPGLDAAPRTPRIFMGADASADYNMSQVIYAENVMPVAEGIRSVGYAPLIPASAFSNFDTIFPLRDAEENVVLFSPSANSNYVHDTVTNTWSALGGIATIFSKTLAAGLDPTATRVTYAYVDGKTFVCYARMKSNDVTPVDMSIMQWNSATADLVSAAPIILNLPFPAGEIDGISSSSGYLLVWSGLTIAWAPFNGTAFDFQIYANGAFTGAGYQIPEDIQGPITAIIGMAGGFIAFTKRNAIAGNYHSQSITSPWVFREVPDAGGLESYEQATVEGSLARLYAYTSSGMQSMSLNSAEIVHPQVADFIAGRQWEIYDFATHSLARTASGVDLFTKITVVGNRYIVVSYGGLPKVYSFALVWDVALRRWGKLRIKHTDCFYYTYQSLPGDISYGQLLDVSYDDLGTTPYSGMTIVNESVISAQSAMAFLQEDGSVQVATWAQRNGDEDLAVAILGRVQLSRARNVQLSRVEVEGLSAGTVYIQPSYDGRNLETAEPTYPVIQESDFYTGGCMIDCKNFNVVIEGTFDLSTVILEAFPTGKF